MKYLLLSSLFVFLFSCSDHYKSLVKVDNEPFNFHVFKPVFSKALYTAQIDVAGRHLSGLLLFKTMPDSSLYLAFTNEMGVKLFEFQFSDTFAVRYIIKKMNRKPVIETLKKDFEMVLMKNIRDNYTVTENDTLTYYKFQTLFEINYVIVDKRNHQLVNVERSSERKPVAKAFLKSYHEQIPDSIFITHSNFNFDIRLTRIVH